MNKTAGVAVYPMYTAIIMGFYETTVLVSYSWVRSDMNQNITGKVALRNIKQSKEIERNDV